MEHTISPYDKQNNPPTDRNDPVGAVTAVEIRFPETFSAKAWKVINYFDNTIFLYVYKGKFVVTDESLELTTYGNGSHEAPLSFPRWAGDSLEELESWLETVADDYDADGEIPGWAVEEKDGMPSEPETSGKPELPPRRKPMKLWLIVEMLRGLVSSLYCVRTQEQAEAEMRKFINNNMLDNEKLICIFANEYLSCEDQEQAHIFTASLSDINDSLPSPKFPASDPYHLHPLPLHDVCVEALERGFTTIYDSRTLIHTPLNEFAEDIDARDYDDTYGYVRFGNIIVGLSDVWETEAEIYELE